MGGNIIVSTVDGKEVEAQKVDLKKVGRAKLIEQAKHLFVALNILAKAKFKQDIWKDIKVIEKGTVFNGSSSFVLSNEYTDDEIIAVKPDMGDIDIAIPENSAEILFQLLQSFQGKNITKSAKFIGMNRTSVASLGTQINTLFEFAEPEPYYVQVDFELLPFDAEDQPTEWARFSHSSTFADAKAGVKAVHHKYLLRALTGAISLRPDVVLATPKSTPDNVKISKSEKGVVRELAFSVDNGLRVAIEPLFDLNGGILEIDGKKVYKKVDSKTSDYKTDLESIYAALFADVRNKKIDEMWTFDGVCALMNKYLKRSQIAQVAERYYDLLWGTGAQGLERANPELDLKIKSAGWNRFCELCKQKNPASFEADLEKYYGKYRMNESSEDVETLNESVKEIDKLLKVEKTTIATISKSKSIEVFKKGIDAISKCSKPELFTEIKDLYELHIKHLQSEENGLIFRKMRKALSDILFSWKNETKEVYQSFDSKMKEAFDDANHLIWVLSNPIAKDAVYRYSDNLNEDVETLNEAVKPWKWSENPKDLLNQALEMVDALDFDGLRLALNANHKKDYEYASKVKSFMYETDGDLEYFKGEIRKAVERAYKEAFE